VGVDIIKLKVGVHRPFYPASITKKSRIGSRPSNEGLTQNGLVRG